jgi:hypothetical protein
LSSLGRRLEALEGELRIPETEARREEEKRASEVRARINAELERLEARVRSMSPEELKAWRNSPEVLAEKEELEAEIERRRRAGGT